MYKIENYHSMFFIQKWWHEVIYIWVCTQINFLSVFKFNNNQMASHNSGTWCVWASWVHCVWLLGTTHPGHTSCVCGWADHRRSRVTPWWPADCLGCGGWRTSTWPEAWWCRHAEPAPLSAPRWGRDAGDAAGTRPSAWRQHAGPADGMMMMTIEASWCWWYPWRQC